MSWRHFAIFAAILVVFFLSCRLINTTINPLGSLSMKVVNRSGKPLTNGRMWVRESGKLRPIVPPFSQVAAGQVMAGTVEGIGGPEIYELYVSYDIGATKDRIAFGRAPLDGEKLYVVMIAEGDSLRVDQWGAVGENRGKP